MWALLFIGQAWQSIGDIDGLSIDVRKIPNSNSESVRVQGEVQAPPEVTAEVIWGPPGIEGVANKKAVHQHEVLEDRPGQRRYYEVVSAPLISDRDYVLALTRRQDGEVHEIRFKTVEDPRRPPQQGRIRMTIEGSVVIVPDGKGGSLITYEVFTELGGSLPAWIARGPQRDSSVEWMKTMIGRVRKQQAGRAP